MEEREQREVAQKHNDLVKKTYQTPKLTPYGTVKQQTQSMPLTSGGDLGNS